MLSRGTSQPSTSVSGRGQLALGLLLGVAADALVPDPRRGHPVAGFGKAAGMLERRIWADDRSRGVGFSLVAVGAPLLGAGWIQNRTSPRHQMIAVALTTWAVLGARSLRAEASAVYRYLQADDLAAARRQLTHLVGRDPSNLNAAEIARAAVESVAENSCDAVVAPLFWGAMAGLPGLVGYRAVNTLDAMVGHRTPRYERFGWASARLDDAANLLPARLSVLLVAAVAGAVDGSPAEVVRTARRDGRSHPSPNSGLSEAAFAGALKRRLGGRNIYDGRVEHRPVLGSGTAVEPTDLARANRLAGAVTVACALAAAGLAVLGSGPFRRRSQ